MKRVSYLLVASAAFAAACGDSAPTTPRPATTSELTPAAPRFDDIPNNLDGTIDSDVEVMALNVGGANGTTSLYVQPRNGDGKTGCNFNPGTTLVVSIASSNPAVATVSLSPSGTFASCGDVRTVTVTPLAVGSTTISITQTSNSTGGTFNLAPASFAVNVAPPANTAPSVVVAGVTGGASYDKGSVPAATCQVTDTEDGPSSFAATLGAVTGPHAADGIGSQTASCSYTDAGGLTASASAAYGIVDPSAPTIAYALNPVSPDGSNGWYTTNVALTWTVTESESPSSLTKTGCVDQNVTADQAATTYKCSATSAGGSASEVSVTIKRDAAAPTIGGAATTAPNGNGWYKSSVNVTFTCGDATSGVASCGPNQTLSAEGAGQSATGNAADNAGNTASAAVSGINIDKTAPTVDLVGGPAHGGTYYFGGVPAAPTCSASDALSGLDGSCSVSGYGAALGTHTVTATVADKAGNSSSTSATYTVKAWTLAGFYQPVDMNGVVNTVKAGSTVPFKFEAFAGPTELTATSAVKSFTTLAVACGSSTSTEDEIEVVSTGGTSLRYDTVAGQFVQNWLTPKSAGACYKVTMTTQDGSKLEALFKLK
jgi:hypothetical protein